MATNTPTSGHDAGFLERLDPNDRSDHQAAQHWARYEFACQFLPARRVLDCACGLGYGTALLKARGGAACVGIDICQQTIDAARKRYGGPGVEFVSADALALDPHTLGAFERIVSLETIEHLPEPQRFLDVLKPLLAPDGVLILSCPNDAHFAIENPYHLWRADPAELQTWLRARFAHVSCYAEMHTLGVSVWPIENIESRPEPSRRYALTGRLIDTIEYTSAPGFVFACANQSLPPAAPVAAELLNGGGYLRELEDTKNQLWNDLQYFREENQRLAKTWEEQRLHIQEQKLRIDELDQTKDRIWQETQTLSAEAHRLAEAWETQKNYINGIENQLKVVLDRGREYGIDLTRPLERSLSSTARIIYRIVLSTLRR